MGGNLFELDARVVDDVRPGWGVEREFFIDNLLVRIHFIIVMIRWTGLAPWEFEEGVTCSSLAPASWTMYVRNSSHSMPPSSFASICAHPRVSARRYMDAQPSPPR